MPFTKASAEEFVVAWQSSATLAEAAKKAGASPRAASARACYLRKLGVPLRRFGPAGPRSDIAGLAALARKVAQ